MFSVNILACLLVVSCSTSSVLGQECPDQAPVINNYWTSTDDPPAQQQHTAVDLQGKPGKRGPAGEKGDQGDQGYEGQKGEKGSNGETGLQGQKGNQGVQGIQGMKGDPGPEGPVGQSCNTTEILEMQERISRMKADFNQKLSELEKNIDDQKQRDPDKCPNLTCGSLRGGGGQEYYQREVTTVAECMDICYAKKMSTHADINAITVSGYGEGACFCQANVVSRGTGCHWQSCFLP